MSSIAAPVRIVDRDGSPIKCARSLALDELRPHDRARERAQRQTEIKKALRDVERKLENLADAVANDGAVPAVLAALTRKDAERQALRRELAALDQSESETLAFEPAVLRKQLHALLGEWQKLAAGNVAEARRLLEDVLDDRIVWEPITTSDGRPGYKLRMPIAFDRMLTSIVPGLQVGVASLMPASWNQMVLWLRQVDELRAA